MTLTGKEAEPSVVKTIPCTPSQIEIWLQCSLGGKEASLAYSESYSNRLFGQLNLNCIKDAYRVVSEKHEGMRAVFSSDGSQISILDLNDLAFSYSDISGLPDKDKDEYLQNHAKNTGLYGFDLVKGPLHALELIKISDDDHMLTFTGHHIMFDGWSITLFFSHLGLVYSQLCNGEPIFLPEIHQLSDYGRRLRNYMSSAEYKINVDYWFKKLNNPIPQLDLPIDFERPEVRNLKASYLTYHAKPGLMLRAKRFGIQQKVSMHVFLLSVYEIFLAQWARNSDVVVGMPRAGQPVMGCSNMMGHSVFLLPNRVNVIPELSFSEYLQQRSREFTQVLEHGIVSFGELVQSLKLKRDSSRIPLFSTTFNNSIGQERKMKFGSLERLLIANPKSYGNFEILLHLFGTIENPTYEWTYNESLFKKESITKAAQKYDELINLLVANPSLKISSIYAIMDEFDKLGQIDLTFATYQENSDPVEIRLPSVVELFELAAKSYADKIAITTHSEHLTYQELNCKANQLAQYLKNKGVRAGDYVGMYLERSNATIISVLGILKAGAAYLPMDVEIPAARIIFMLKDSGAKFYITDQPEFEFGALASKRLELDSLMDDIAQLPVANNPEKTALDNPMYIIYTSGSTGNPKGVILTHKNLNYLVSQTITDLNYHSSDILLGVTSVSFDMATFEILLPYMFGASVFMLDKYQRKDPKLILDYIERKKVTKMFATPTHWQMMVSSGWTRPFTGLSAICAGEPLKKALVDQLAPLTREIYNMYGPTEATVFTVLSKVDPNDSRVTIGKEVPGTTIYFVDQAGNQIQEANKSGEIWIGGDAVGKGYLGLDELTRERFIKNPFASNPECIYKSGDLGFRLDNGDIQCDGRIDHQVKIRGHRIELGEIEQRILKMSPVDNAVVSTMDSEGFLSLVAYILIKKEEKQGLDFAVFTDRVREFLSSSLPEYMIPESFIMVDEFILTTSGKIDRNRLPKTGIDATKQEVNNDIANDLLSEFSEIEKRVFHHWTSVLGNSRLSPDADFFLSGGHSLLGVKLVSMLEKEFDTSLTLLTLFQYPTIRLLAGYIATETKGNSSDSLVLIKKGNPDKVLCFVHGVGLNPIEVAMVVEHMDEDQTIYGLQSPAIAGQSRPYDSIEEIAGHYIEELDRGGIKAPYNLIGNSIGGLIVFEMCRQLLLSNRPLGFIGMIDTLANFYYQKPKNLTAGISKSLKKISFELQFLLKDLPYYLKHRKGYLRDKFRGLKPPMADTGLASRIQEIESVNKNAWKNYKLAPLDIDLTLFLAKNRTFFVEDFETLGWKKYARQIERIIMPGDHANMLKPPHGVEFSRTLQIKLNQYKPS